MSIDKNTIQKTINLEKNKIQYSLKISKRAKRMRIAVYCDGKCVVTVPKMLSENVIEKFLINKSKWLLDKINYFKSSNLSSSKKDDSKEFLKYKDDALKLVEKRLNYFNNFYNYSWNKITIKNQKTRWGSCSRKKNLNFNYKIALLSKDIVDYIIVHELCHLKEFNHSKKFWNLVEKGIPNYLDIRNKLKKGL